MSSSILKVRDQNGNWIQIPAIKGDKGDKGTFDDLTEEQKDSLRGEDGNDGLTPRILNGTWWIGDVDTKVPASTNVAVGSYIGTGTGAFNNEPPTILNFDFTPKFLLITHGNGSVIDPYLGIFIKGRSSGMVFVEGETVEGFGDYYSTIWGASTFCDVTFSDNSVSISHNEEGRQFNSAGRTYFYLAIGNGIYPDGDEVEY